MIPVGLKEEKPSPDNIECLYKITNTNGKIKHSLAEQLELISRYFLNTRNITWTFNKKQIAQLIRKEKYTNKMLNFHTILNKRLGKKLLSILVIIVNSRILF